MLPIIAEGGYLSIEKTSAVDEGTKYIVIIGSEQPNGSLKLTASDSTDSNRLNPDKPLIGKPVAKGEVCDLGVVRFFRPVLRTVRVQVLSPSGKPVPGLWLEIAEIRSGIEGMRSYPRGAYTDTSGWARFENIPVKEKTSAKGTVYSSEGRVYGSKDTIGEFVLEVSVDSSDEECALNLTLTEKEFRAMADVLPLEKYK